MSWTAVVIAAVTGLSGGGLVAIVQGFFQRRTTKVDAVDRLADTAVEWAAAVKADAADARKEAADARDEARGARRELTEVHRQMRELADEVEMVTLRLRQWRTAILDPDATLARLRSMVEAEGTHQHLNGRT